MSSADAATPGAMHVFYEEHHGWLSAWLRRRLGCSHSAADLAQDTFVRVLLRPQVLPTLREPRAYLSTLAKGVVIEHVRRRSLERACLEALAVLPEPLALSPESLVLLVEALVRIDAMLDGLASKARGAFVLSRLDGLTYVAIAGRLQISERTVKRYMQQGFERCLALVE
jgi:RNA polymerase sigma factor (sigma-70 family)